MSIDRTEYISSKQNEKIKAFSKLSQSKYRREMSLFLAEGVKLAEECVDSGCAECMLISEERFDDAEVKRVLDKCGDNVIQYILAAPAFEKVTSESAPQGIIAVSRFPSCHKASCDAMPSSLDGKLVIAFDGIRDPGNLGAVMRSALAFGYDAVLLGDCADVYGGKAARASMGAVFKLPVIFCDDMSEYLRSLSDRGRRIIGAAATEGAHDIRAFDLQMNDVVVIGNEGHGISRSVSLVCKDYLMIPMDPRSESLNAAVASSVIMWEYSKLTEL
ncbi:MAG: RNA methyltransferase [Clostridia bacterium]|nr:RNA methyltransferase [Clostridia bacterium]